MSIPKKIHFCWFGGNEYPDLVKKCIASWKKYCPDYELIKWNEDNFDVNQNKFVKQAYEAKKWAFVSDYARLKIIYDHGGIYLDTDVELIKSLDHLLIYSGFLGFQESRPYEVATGLGFGAEQGDFTIQSILSEYETLSFIKNNGEYDLTPCPQRDTKILIKHGLEPNGLTQYLNDFIVLSPEHLCPISFLGEELFTENTVSIHHFSASWYDELMKRQVAINNKLIRIFGSKATLAIFVFKIYFEIKRNGLISVFKKIKNKHE